MAPDRQKRKFTDTRQWKILRPVLIVAISLVVVLIIVLSVISYVETNYFSPVDPDSTDVVEVEIPKSSSLADISEILETNNLIRSKTCFKLYADFSDVSYKLKAGRYNLSPSMTYDDIIYTIMKGNPPATEIKFTFIEGLTVVAEGKQLSDAENGGIYKTPDRFYELCKDGAKFEKYSFVKDVIDKQDARNYVLEGYLFPDTYRYYSDAPEEDIIIKQLDQFDKIFTDEYRERAEELGMSVDEVVTLASIIEKESITEDFTKVSAVFHNRLKADMPLQSCATMQAVTGESKYTFTEEEKAIDSPYNTYMYKGLPVGPICNPGQKAIEAALYPDQEFMDEGYMYFCLTDPKIGTQVFAKTYEEHLENIEKYEVFWQ